MPDEFISLLEEDLEEAELLLILGTSLQVVPVSMIPDSVRPNCRRVLLNMSLVGDLDLDNPKRDLFHPGNCDDSVQAICRALGWEEELVQQHKTTQFQSTD